MTATITGAGSALPAPMDQQALWDGFFREHYADARIARKVWQSSAITTRRAGGASADTGPGCAGSATRRGYRSGVIVCDSPW